MIYQKHTYKGAIQRYSHTFSVMQCNTNLHLKTTVEMQVTNKEELLLNSLRGLNGKQAKLRAFKLMIEIGNYTFEQLAEFFPVYIPKK